MIIFVIQNNRYGISVPVTQQSANTRISDNYTGLANLKIINVDGTDFVDSYQGMVAAREHALSGEGPVLVHAQCERLGAHSNSDRHELYRTSEEIERLQALDPLAALRARLLEAGLMTEEELVAVEAENETMLARDAEAQRMQQILTQHQVESYVFAPAWQCRETATPADGDKWKIERHY